MSAAQPLTSERRRFPRWPTAFAFWVAKPHDQRVGAWMLDLSVQGGAFLVTSEDDIKAGQRLDISEMLSCSPIVRQGSFALPPHAEVVRVEETGGPTRKVAVRFETPLCETPIREPIRHATASSIPPAPLALEPIPCGAEPADALC